MGCASSSAVDGHHAPSKERYEVKARHGEESPHDIGPSATAARPTTPPPPLVRGASASSGSAQYSARSDAPPRPREAFKSPSLQSTPRNGADDVTRIAVFNRRMRSNSSNRAPAHCVPHVGPAPPTTTVTPTHAAAAASTAQGFPPVVIVSRQLSNVGEHHGARTPSSTSQMYYAQSQEPSTPDLAYESDQPYGRFVHGPTREPDPTMHRTVWSLREIVGEYLPMDDFVGQTPDPVPLLPAAHAPTTSSSLLLPASSSMYSDYIASANRNQRLSWST